MHGQILDFDANYSIYLTSRRFVTLKVTLQKTYSPQIIGKNRKLSNIAQRIIMRKASWILSLGLESQFATHLKSAA